MGRERGLLAGSFQSFGCTYFLADYCFSRFQSGPGFDPQVSKCYEQRIRGEDTSSGAADGKEWWRLEVEAKAGSAEALVRSLLVVQHWSGEEHS